MRKLVFLSGLPRSGSTLLLNILGQNPMFHVTGTSGLLDLVCTVKARAWELPAIRAMGDQKVDAKIIQTLRGLINGFYADAPEACIAVEKSRGWEGQIEMLRELFQVEPKIICPVRDVREILASFEKLYRKTVTSRVLPDERAFPFKFKTIQGRCHNLLMVDGGVVGVPINLIRDAVARGCRKNLLFVDFAVLTQDLRGTLKRIYEFIGEPEFAHDGTHIKQITREDDLVHVYKNLHDIRPSVDLVPPDWDKVLPKAITDDITADAKFWLNL